MDIPVELSRVLITEVGEQQVYLREKGGERAFPIAIGLFEAWAINRRLKQEPVPRPMTHELLANVIEAMGGRPEKIVINDLRKIDPMDPGMTFFATLYIRRDGELIEVDSRPSDAIALGVAFNTPIFVAEHVMDGVLSNHTTKEERVELLKRRMHLLSAKISTLEQRLSDKEFVGQAMPDVIAAYHKQRAQMKAEYEAIDGVLKKLGL